MSNAEEHFDIVIIGAGPAGLSFARTLADTGLQIALLEKLDENVLADPPNDGRDIALTHTTESAMRDLGMWDHIPADQIGTIRDAKVVNGKSPYALHFDARKTDADYLGHIVPNFLIRRAAYNSVQGYDNIKLITGVEVTDVQTDTTIGKVTLKDGTTLSAKLVIAADSRFSNTRRKMGISAAMQDFGRTVIVCEMEHELTHHDTATECFHYDQTLAILPMHGKLSSVVVTLPADRADAVMAMTPEAFADDIAERFGRALGKMTLVSERHTYPLVAVYADKFITTRFALVGDAAVGMHPVTAHGFNLGLYGAEVLAQEVRKALRAGMDIGDFTVLSNYQSRHRRKSRPMYLGTNALVRLYTDTSAPAKFLRDTALRLGNILPPVKSRIMRQLTEIDRKAG